MSAHLRNAAAALAGMGIAASACTSLLGDFTSRGAGGPPSDAATTPTDVDLGDSASQGDSMMTGPDAQASTDGPADGGPPPLSCTTWKWSQPLVLEDLSMATEHRFGSSITAFQLGGGPFRVIASKVNSPLFSVYTVNPATQTVQQLDEPGPGVDSVVGMWRDRGTAAYQTAVVGHVTSDSQFGTYEVFAIPDTMSATGPVPNPFALFTPTATSGVSSLTVTPFTTSDIFEAVSVSSGSPANYTLGVGRVSPTSNPTQLGAVATAVNANQFSAPHLYRANSNVYIYNENDPSTPGTTGWTVPESAVTPEGGVPAQVISSGLLSGVVDIAPNATAPSADILTYEEIRTGNIANAYNFRMGVVPNTNLGSWTAMDLSYVAKYTALHNPPLFSGSQMFWGDDIMLLGQGFCIISDDGAPCTTSPGLNLLWLNASTGVRAQQYGATQILAGQTGFFDVFTVPSQITATSAEWDVVWGQHMQAGTPGAYDVLYMNVLECQ